MIRPEPMRRAVVVSSKSRERAVIEALHDLQAAHLVDFVETGEGDLAGFRLGKPLEGAEKTSGQLVRLRSLQRALELEGRTPQRAFNAREIEETLDQALDQAELDATNATEARDRYRQTLDNLNEETRKLQPLAGLPLSTGDLRGYRSLRVFAGTTDEPAEAAVNAIAPDHLTFRAPSGAFALFVPADKGDEVLDALLKKGYKELEVPEGGEGTIDERLRAIANETRELEQKLTRADEEVARVRERWGDFILAADEHLSIAVEKAEAPLRFASSANAFVVEAWIPASEVSRVQAALERATDGAVHIEVHGTAHRHEHTESGAVEGSREGHAEGHVETDAPPTKLRHSGYPKPFEFFTNLFSVPKHNEIDPTLVLAITFPLFYGFMIGDLGYGVIMAALGALLILKLGHMAGMKQLGTAILTAGIVAALFGGLVFSDAFGIPFYAHHELEGEVLAEGAAHGLTACQVFAEHAGETTWSCILGGELVVHHNAWYQIAKLTDVSTLLVLSILVALVHLSLGLVFGIVNEMGHSAKHATAKAAWLLLLVAFFLLVVSQTTELSDLSKRMWDGGLASVGSGLVVLGLVVVSAVLLLVTEGAIALVEMPSLLSNLLSYTRLAGVAVAKAAMAVAFNGLFLVGMIMNPHPSWGLIIAGALLLIITQLLVLVLGILSSGIQAIRLNYVEFFTKFYKGGGKPFAPFGRSRQFTLESSQPTME